MSEYMLPISRTAGTFGQYTGVATIRISYEGTGTKYEVSQENGEIVTHFWGDNPAVWCEQHGFSKVRYEVMRGEP